MVNRSGRATDKLLFIIAFLFTAACSDGGGNRGIPSPANPPSGGGGGGGGPVWTQGVYQSSAVFQDRCQVVRTGVDIEGNPFPDQAGSTLEENFWLRSWTHETYLWNNEVVDQNPANFTSPIAYFDVLKTTAVTPSGKPKDEFHFSQPTADFLAARNSAPTADYGAGYIAFSTTPPRDFRIAYTEPGSPAAEMVSGLPNFVRGARILEIDGVDFVNANSQADVDALNAGLFPATAGEMHTFVMEDPGSPPRTVILTSANLSSSAVLLQKTITTATGKVGYAVINTFSPFSSEQEISDAISFFSTEGVSDVVLDLRYNGGGLLAIASQLGFMVAGNAQTAGKDFESLQFNADAGNLNPITGQVNQPTPFYTTGLGFTVPNGTPLTTLNLSRVYVLTTGDTCSASESVINSLRGIDVEVILIGDTTCGKPFGFFPDDNCGETYFTIQFQGVNDKGFGDYADGFIPQNSPEVFGVRAPGCLVADDFTKALGDETEGMLKAALDYRASGTCPALPPVTTTITTSAVKTGESGAITIPEPDIFATNRDMTMPN